MSVSLVVIRLELADDSRFPEGFQYCAGDMSDDELIEKSLRSANASLDGKTSTEKTVILHQHIGSRAMMDMAIETISPSQEKGDSEHAPDAEDSKSGVCEAPSTSDTNSKSTKEAVGTVPDSPSKQLPDQISFFSGNPSVEIVHGILHLYKTNKMTSLTEDVRRSAMLCILTVPATMTSHDLMKFVAPYNDVMEHMKIIRDSTPNQYMVLVKFRSQGASLPVMDLTELPKCTVCLERMDESVNGVLTTLCNHSFHSQCLQRWEDATCPVCRYCQTPEPVEENKCFECGVQENLWICLICGHIGCGRYVSRHAYKHFEETQHTYAMQLTNHRVWDYAGDNYVHRLVASKTDGKIVQYECEGDSCQDEKIDALQLEVNTRLAKLSVELQEEQEMNKCLRANQSQLQARLKEEERRLRETSEQKERQITELQEQLRDVMFYLETQQQINQMPAEARQEIQEGQINIAVAASSNSPALGSTGKLSTRKGRGKRGK
ncbi:UNVERIFIED_CONTAM: hypothetical protein FKN15_008362 [Acipenser sinensis]